MITLSKFGNPVIDKVSIRAIEELVGCPCLYRDSYPKRNGGKGITRYTFKSTTTQPSDEITRQVTDHLKDEPGLPNQYALTVRWYHPLQGRGSILHSTRWAVSITIYR